MSRARKEAGLWIRLAKCTDLVLQEIRRSQQESLLTLPQFDVMAQLLRHPDGMTTGALSEALLVTAGNVTGITRRLLEQGLISVRPGTRDRRTKIHRLTLSGRRLATREVRRMESLLGDVFSDLKRTEQLHLQRTLDQLRSILELRRAAG